MTRTIARAVAMLAVATIAALPAQAQYTFVPTRAGIGGTGLINWASLGPTETLVSSPTSGITVSGTSLTATVSQASAQAFERRDEGSSWTGNFTPGSALLWTRGNNGPVTIMFSSAVGAAGSAYMTNYNGAFTGTIDALDASQNVLATFVFSGTSTGARDGSAPFVGISSSLNNIMGIRFTGVTADTDPNDFAIDNVSVNAGSVVPEPSTYALMGTGLVGLVGVARRKRNV